MTPFALAGALVIALMVALPAAAGAAGGGVRSDHVTLVGEKVEVESRLAGPGGRARHTKLGWRVVKKQRRARVKLTGRRKASPKFSASRIGTYVLRLTVRKRSGRTSRSRVTVAVRPDDPPIGVSLETLSDDPAGAIKINGNPLSHTSDRSGIFVAVLDRESRDPVDWGTTPRHRGGLDQLNAMAMKYSGTDGYLMIVSGAHGLFPGDLNEFDKLRDKIGALPTTKEERSRLANGQPFSMIGIPGGARDSAWSNIGQGAGPEIEPGSIRGYLQVNYGSGTGWYDYVSPERPTFDTQLGGAQSGRNTIRLGGRTFEAALPDGATDGFHILVLNAFTLEPISNRAMPTNGPGSAEEQQFNLLETLRSLADSAPPQPIVIVQSIGRPRGVSTDFGSAADQIERMGGTRLVFTALDGSRGYTLVGGPAVGGAAVETSTTDGTARTVGGLQRGHDLSFKPTVGGPRGGVNTELIDLSYQAPTPFPPFEGTGEKNAETYIGKKIHLCADSAPVCSIRPLYYKDRREELSNALGTLRSSDLNYPGDLGFKLGEYNTVREQLKVELDAVNRVREYFEALGAPFDKAELPGRINLKKVGDTIYNAVRPPPADNTTSRGLELGSKLASLTGILPSPFGNLGKGIGSVLGLSAFLTRPDGSTLLADEVKVKADALAEDFQNRMFRAGNSLIGLEYLFVSDYGKLSQMAARLPTDEWRLDNTPRSLNPLDLGSRRWYAEQLVPVAYPWVVRGTPPPEGPATANGLGCYSSAPQPPPSPPPPGFRPWAREPANAQYRPVEGWLSDGEPVRPHYFLSQRLSPSSDLSVAPSVADLLFNPVNPTTGTLGFDKLTFLSPRVFGKIHVANHLTFFCDLLKPQGDDVVERLSALELDPVALFPEEVPDRLDAALVSSKGAERYRVKWDRGEGLGKVVLRRGQKSQLKPLLRDARRRGDKTRKVKIGSRKRWLVCGQKCGYAWTQAGRTYSVLGEYPENSDAALKRDERALIRNLRPVT